MAEIDPVILQLKAELDKYRADISATAAAAERSFSRQDRSVRNLEKQMQRSSSAISGTLKGLAASFAAAFSTVQIVDLIDRYTRLQNALRVAGLEGQQLARVQGQLLELSGRYGVSINGLSDLYGKIAQSQSDLGASSGDIVRVTEATAAALRITGTSAVQAQGALLGLSQALASGVVRAEEFNQINEGGLRPLLQVAANAEAYGGSVARLRQAMVDGKVSSQEFYTAIIAGSQELVTKAASANLTLSGAVEGLTSQLVVYFGEAGKGAGITQALTNAIQGLANNLDTIIPLLATIAGIVGVRYVASLVAATASSIALRVATAGLALQLGGIGPAAGAAGRGLVAAFGGPVGILIAAIGAALYGVSVQQDLVARGNETVRATTARVTTASDAAKNTIDRLANSYGRAREEALSLARAQLQLANVQVAKAGRESIIASAEESRIAGIARRTPGRGGAYASEAAYIARQNADAAARNYQAAVQTRDALEAAINRPTTATGAGAAAAAAASNPRASGGGGGGGGRSAPSGPSAEEINARFNSEVYAITNQILSARRQQAASAQEEADLSLTGVELARRQALQDIEANRDYSGTQKDILREHVERLAQVEREGVERDRQLRIEREATELATAQFSAQQEELQGAYDLARSSGERRDIAMQILDLEFRHREALLQAVLASETTSDHEKAIAQATLDRLTAIRGNATEAARRGTAGPGEAYLDSLIQDAGELNDAFDNIAVEGLKSLNDGLAAAIMGSKSLGDVFKNVANQIVADLLRIAIQQSVIQPLSQSLFGGGKSGGIFGSIVGALGGVGGVSKGASGSFVGLPKRASGGYLAPGQVARVNEGAAPGRVELFRSPGGTVIPLGQISSQGYAGSSGGGGVATVRVMLSDDLNGRIVEVSGNVAAQVIRSAAPTLVDASANEALRRASRPPL